MEELTSNFNSGKLQYGFTSVKTPGSTQRKVILIHWVLFLIHIGVGGAKIQGFSKKKNTSLTRKIKGHRKRLGIMIQRWKRSLNR